ncbi:UDP-2,3-diacylglucosamine diphosphatase LpxI [Limimaricola variabilis]|uniref:LpxI family protein n=1 Tax=Limimaricola variabilis TaxID=1492771 RepID=UPI002AC912D6|nr:UDP-2,3-diacylglucosamine diphosphatase LpxI [Limimaricola variabilis]WPY95411.1 UDP-2,3-diacylglucosamine diphosphatase LpxI [Limimaricola variabilis]
MLALLAGTGALPAAILAQRPKALVCEMAGVPVSVPEGAIRIGYRVETLGTLLAELRARGVTEICLAGAMSRPAIDPAAIDAATAPLVPRLMGAMGQGDDATLRAVMALLEEQGFALRAAHEIAPGLLPGPGTLGGVPFTDALDADASRAQVVHRAMAEADVGQACVVRGGLCLAVEALPGTDWMLASLSGGEARGGLLFKAPKPGQDRRADLPVIGPATVEGAARAGLAAIVIEAGGVLLLERAETIALADRHGIALVAR